jgi:hypothetical protein
MSPDTDKGYCESDPFPDTEIQIQALLTKNCHMFLPRPLWRISKIQNDFQDKGEGPPLSFVVGHLTHLSLPKSGSWIRKHCNTVNLRSFEIVEIFIEKIAKSAMKTHKRLKILLLSNTPFLVTMFYSYVFRWKKARVSSFQRKKIRKIRELIKISKVHFTRAFTKKTYLVGYRYVPIRCIRYVCGCHAVFRIRIRKVFGLPDLLVRESQSKKNLDFYCFVTSLWFFIWEEWCKCTLKK